jgi:hypothetical protein
MNSVRLGFRKVDIVDGLRASALVLLIVMAITFFAGCVTERIDSEGNVIRKPKADHQSPGQADASSGRNG